MRQYFVRFVLILFAVVFLAIGCWIILGSTASLKKILPQPGKASAPAAAKANIPATDARTAPPAALLRLRDDPQSTHPVERAIAAGEVLETRFSAGNDAQEWFRLRLVRSPVLPDHVLRAVEQWRIDPSGTPHSIRRDLYTADQLIVHTQSDLSEDAARNVFAPLRPMAISRLKAGVFSVRLPTATLDSTDEATRTLAAQHDIIATAEADGVGFGGGTPNDTYFSNQWGWHNTGQVSGSVTGSVDADVDAPEFWDIAGDATGVTIAVLDSGLNYTHPDLLGVAWTNPGETAADGIDNDANGKIDDMSGWDWVNNDNNPADDHGHGTNVTSIMVALRNNGIGTAGLVSGARILVCKILNSSNSGLTSHLIAATAYTRERGVRLMNLSLQNYPFNSSLNDEFTACQNAGILLSICAGNQGANNDTTPNYPSSYTQANIISVGNHDRTDQRWSGSNFGALSVDLFAPGREIYGAGLTTGFSVYTGTSQATPAVTAVCAQLLALNPSWSHADIKAAILSSVVARTAYSGICSAAGRLNALDALAYSLRRQAARDTDGDNYSDLVEYLAGTRIDSATSKPNLTTELTGGDLRLRAPRVPRADSYFEIEKSTDLVNWTTTGVTDESSPSELVGRVTMPPETGRIFLRLKAVVTP